MRPDADPAIYWIIAKTGKEIPKNLPLNRSTGERSGHENPRRTLDCGDVLGKCCSSDFDGSARKRSMQNPENLLLVTIRKSCMTDIDARGRCRESEDVPRLDSTHDFGNSFGRDDITRPIIEASLHLADFAEYILVR